MTTFTKVHDAEFNILLINTDIITHVIPDEDNQQMLVLTDIGHDKLFYKGSIKDFLEQQSNWYPQPPIERP